MALRAQHVPFLKKLKVCRNLTKRKRLLANGGRTLQKILREIAFNVLKGNIKLTKRQLSNLKRHKKAVRLLASKTPSVKRRLKVEQKGGFLSALIAPVLTALASSVLS